MTIAILDDDDLLRKAISRLLRSNGFYVKSYGEGANFFEDLTSGEQPDCVLLDLHMPEMDGFEVMTKLSKEKIAIPVIVITAHDEPENRARALALGASAYLRKPVDESELIEAINASYI